MLDLDYDFEQSIRSYEYTKAAGAALLDVIISDDFEDDSVETIFNYLKYKMVLVNFKDYLKRYLYYEMGEDTEFSEIPDEVYLEIMKYSFEENKAPYSFEPTTRKKSVILKSFLNIVSAKRDTVFLLGFGLKMKVEDVKEFLTKVLLESPFDFNDPRETIFWYCFKKQLPYARANTLMKYYEEITPDDTVSEKRWNEMKGSAELIIVNEDQLKSYLQHQKKFAGKEVREEKLYQTFDEIYKRCQAVLADYENKYSMKDEKIEPEDIGISDIERYFCEGIPMVKNGNYEKLSKSLLKEQFKNRRMSRQRLNKILKRTASVERFDLISLLFLYYALAVEPTRPVKRYQKFIDEINEILTSNQMMGIYPTNAYESFILMCLLCEEPISVYSDTFSVSYGEEG